MPGATVRRIGVNSRPIRRVLRSMRGQAALESK
jgi:hypothetical protein